MASRIIKFILSLLMTATVLLPFGFIYEGESVISLALKEFGALPHFITITSTLQFFGFFIIVHTVLCIIDLVALHETKFTLITDTSTFIASTIMLNYAVMDSKNTYFFVYMVMGLVGLVYILSDVLFASKRINIGYSGFANRNIFDIIGFILFFVSFWMMGIYYETPNGHLISEFRDMFLLVEEIGLPLDGYFHFLFVFGIWITLLSMIWGRSGFRIYASFYSLCFCALFMCLPFERYDLLTGTFGSIEMTIIRACAVINIVNIAREFIPKKVY